MHPAVPILPDMEQGRGHNGQMSRGDATHHVKLSSAEKKNAQNRPPQLAHMRHRPRCPTPPRSCNTGPPRYCVWQSNHTVHVAESQPHHSHNYSCYKQSNAFF
ncbi:hypothetical protein HPP92_025594 [Vanilla planifolia]|uniref:Uncharacterized protein n=1 Tax=Vanilla planifolia TaxID=51239 RepID=A0A835PKW9_VANPL|nr:hypothetical protein HPP92_025594 [Vanilla planifolia]